MKFIAERNSGPELRSRAAPSQLIRAKAPSRCGTLVQVVVLVVGKLCFAMKSVPRGAVQDIHSTSQKLEQIH